MKYQTSLLEDWIQDFYYHLDIYHPHQLDFLEIAARLGLYIHFQKFSSRIYAGEIIIDERLSEQGQWEDFAHELCHLYRQDGNQLAMNKEFLLLQESKADNFALHFCIPTFMLLKNTINNFLDIDAGTPFVMEKFNVSEVFARKRLQQFKSKILQAKADEEHRKFMNSIYPKAGPYSEETNSTLDKLQQIIDKKKGVS
ncbi:ImmA/IrrE family metallo-endopeptidase [Rossellomorea vietnamensis]|uniref:ImmA/IrrE family metallo-endopeptidase n=1 Tax=Rossellomorea vietnamensis TaxID=218284 RepID=A0A5D4MDP6_9BACI|nr:ImmA/IrrE family metallo-endopeptidase [Rossellomorea vietnamensis]TYR99110.1 ImmA/IrrE family metallo-endopeptidase [Rossellomorea vietnamensis]